ncbi:MAG: hypothetical protein ACRC7O_05555 [Fimbriiglobus sp.]
MHPSPALVRDLTSRTVAAPIPRIAEITVDSSTCKHRHTMRSGQLPAALHEWQSLSVSQAAEA